MILNNAAVPYFKKSFVCITFPVEETETVPFVFIIGEILPESANAIKTFRIFVPNSVSHGLLVPGDMM
jgi:hypothetical protein